MSQESTHMYQWLRDSANKEISLSRVFLIEHINYHRDKPQDDKEVKQMGQQVQGHLEAEVESGSVE